MKKYQNKYRIPSARLQSWDYGNNGVYFITICTKDRIHFFGKIVNTDIPSMQLNAFGEIAHNYWMEIPNHFPFVELANFVVMPNHTHGILIIDKNNDIAGEIDTNNIGGNPSNLMMDDHAVQMPNLDTIQTPNLDTVQTPNLGPVQTPNLGVSTHNKNPKPGGKNEKWKPASIGVIINQYKRIVTINARKINPEFGWQTRFHDSIIRDDASFQRVQKYITDNPKNWYNDKFHGKSNIV